MKISHKRNPYFAYSACDVFLQEVEPLQVSWVFRSHMTLAGRNVLILQTLLSQTSCSAFHLRRALRLFTPAVRLMAFKATVQPTLDYASIIWYPYTKKHVNEIKKYKSGPLDLFITVLAVL